MSQRYDIQEGMQVYGGDQLLGRVERLHGDGFHVNGLHYTREMVTRVEHNRIYLGDAASRVEGGVPGGATQTAGSAASGATVARGERRDTAALAGREASPSAQAEGEIRVPVVEERLNVGKREVELGEVEVRKTVTEEEQTVPVTLTHEEVHIEEREVAARPATGADLFEEGTIRVALRGEEAVVAKEAVVTGEVVIEKESVAEERQITDTVRRQRVEVDEAYRQARGDFERAHAARGTKRSFEEAEPHYRTGFAAAHDARYADRQFEDAEPELRGEHERAAGRSGGGDSWQHLREEIREGWNRARNR